MRDLDRLRTNPELGEIVKTVMREFGEDGEDDAWPVGCRADDASRAIAAYRARRHCGYSATSVAKALGDAHPSGVNHAMCRIDAGSAKLKQTLKRLERRLKRH